MSKTLIVFYSRGSKTRTVSTELKKYIDGDVEELIDLRNRKGLLGYIFAGRDALKKKNTEIKTTKFNPADYDRVIIGTPVWASTMTSAVRTYIGENKGKFKSVAFVVTSGGPVDNKIFDEMSELCGTKPLAAFNTFKKEFDNGSWKDKAKEFASQLK